jgi:outer membrane protein
MRKLILIAVLSSAALAAATGASAAELKVGAVRGQDLVVQSPLFKSMQDKLKGEFEKRQKDFETEAKKFEEDVAKFKKEEGLVSAEQHSKTEKELGSRQVDLNYKQRQLQEDAQKRQTELMQELQGKVKEAINALAKEKSYDLIVLDPVFATDAVDVTDEVLKKLGGPAPKGK